MHIKARCGKSMKSDRVTRWTPARRVIGSVSWHEEDAMTAEPDGSRTEYELEPFEFIFLRRREQILRLVGVAGYALRSMKGAARLSEVLHHPPEEVDRVSEIESLALQEVNEDLPMLHSAASVLLWGALEAAFRDFLVRWFVMYPTARLVPELKNVRVRVTEYEELEREDRMRYLVNLLERELGAALRPGVGRFDCLLKPIGVRPKVADSVRRDLNELAAVRNVIVHCAGIADARLVELCPWLELNSGDAVVIGCKEFESYVAATSTYAAEIIVSAREICRQMPSDGRSAKKGTASISP